MTDIDLPELIGVFLSAWAVGFIPGYLFGAFRRAASLVR